MGGAGRSMLAKMRVSYFNWAGSCHCLPLSRGANEAHQARLAIAHITSAGEGEEWRRRRRRRRRVRASRKESSRGSAFESDEQRERAGEKKSKTLSVCWLGFSSLVIIHHKTHSRTRANDCAWFPLALLDLSHCPSSVLWGGSQKEKNTGGREAAAQHVSDRLLIRRCCMIFRSQLHLAPSASNHPTVLCWCRTGSDGKRAVCRCKGDIERERERERESTK